MRTGRKARNRIGNRGYSLVELIVVISIMTVMVGLLSFGVGMMFTRDANYVAVRIDDELTEARTLAMSREGVFVYSLYMDSDSRKNSVKIYKINSEGDPLTDPPYKEVALDKDVTITIKKTDGTVLTPAAGKSLNIIFDKANGSVKSVKKGDDASESGEGVYTFTVTSNKNSSKVREVTLVATTGRHYTEK